MFAVFLSLLCILGARGHSSLSSSHSNLQSKQHVAKLKQPVIPQSDEIPKADDIPQPDEIIPKSDGIIVEGAPNQTEGSKHPRYRGKMDRVRESRHEGRNATDDKTHGNRRHRHHRIKYPFIHKTDKWLEQHVFGKFTQAWWKDWKLWVGVSFWAVIFARWYASWIKDGFENESYWERAVFAFGINLLVLHALQYSSSINLGMLKVNLMLSGQCMLHNVLWFITGKRDDETSGNGKFVCDTMYLDLSLPLEQICVLFVAQVCIWWFYMTSILGNFSFGHVNYAFWLVAFLSMQMTMIFMRGSDSVLGNPFPIHEVHHWLCNANNLMVRLEGDSKMKRFQVTKQNMLMRGIFGFFCNAVLREIMSYTIPLMLMSFSEPMDFVVYCLGVNFICTIDDMADKTFELEEKGDSSRKNSPGLSAKESEDTPEKLDLEKSTPS